MTVSNVLMWGACALFIAGGIAKLVEGEHWLGAALVLVGTANAILMSR